MTAYLKFYHGDDYTFAFENVNDITAIDVRTSLNGSSSGDITFSLTPENLSNMKSLSENTHFISFSLDGNRDIVGGIIDTAYCTDNECHLKFVGFAEYLDKIVAISSYEIESFDQEIVIGQDDHRWEKNIYSDTSVGLLYEVFLNLQDVMAYQNRTPFWTFAPSVMNYMTTNTDNSWKKTYTLNSAEFPTMKSIIDDITSDSSFPQMLISPDTSTGKFRWIMDFNFITKTFEVHTDVDPIDGLEYTIDGVKNRMNSLAKSETADSDTVISRIKFKDTNRIAYSDYTDDTVQGGDSAYDINQNNVQNLKQLVGQCTFSTQYADYAEINAHFIIHTDDETTDVLVTEVAFNGQSFDITGNVMLDSSNYNINQIKLRKPTNIGSKWLGEPLNQAYMNARKSIFGEAVRTGWRKMSS